MNYFIVKRDEHEIVIMRVEDKTTIPMDEANTDYQAYLEWLAAGNEPEVVQSNQKGDK